jgi:hypothetical protein
LPAQWSPLLEDPYECQTRYREAIQLSTPRNYFHRAGLNPVRVGGARTKRVRKLIAFDDDTFDKLKQLGRDRMATIQDLADEAFADVLKKHGVPVDLKDALRKSARNASSKNASSKNASASKAAAKSSPSRKTKS